jgi:hypothetical protein
LSESVGGRIVGVYSMQEHFVNGRTLKIHPDLRLVIKHLVILGLLILFMDISPFFNENIDVRNIGNSIFMFGYITHKVDKQYKNINRSNIYSYIAYNAGCNISDIFKNLHIPENTIRYHIICLKKYGKINLIKVRNQLRFFKSPDSLNKIDKILIACLHDIKYYALIEAIINTQGITNKELSIKLKVDKSIIHRRVKKLIKFNLVIYLANGKNKHYYVSEDVLPRYYQYGRKVLKKKKVP